MNAEMQFPRYDSLSSDQQKAWGYIVHSVGGSHPQLSVQIPAKAAKFCRGARLYFWDKHHGLLAEINMDLQKAKDGSLSASVSFDQRLNVDAELIVYTEQVPDADWIPDFGGFSFFRSAP
jgi:hypothetical protein